MPPAVFTQEGPIKVATSPMENLLIEHPSMSVYSVVSGTPTTSPAVVVAPDTPPPSPDDNRWTTTTTESRQQTDSNNVKQHHVTDVTNLPQNNTNNNVPPAPPPPANLLSSSVSTLCATVSTSLDCSLDRSNIDELSRRVVAELQAIDNDRPPMSDSNNNQAKIGKQLQTAQKRAQVVRISSQTFPRILLLSLC